MPRDGAIIFADLIGKLVILKNLTHRPTLIASDPQQIRNTTAQPARPVGWKLRSALRPDRGRRIGQCRVRSNIS
jgi:hypothetical protein